MPKIKIPQDAFDFYCSLGPERSYQKVADHYRVTKRAVTKRATKERWQDRLRFVGLSRLAHEPIAELRAWHLRVLRFVKQKAAEALRRLPPEEVAAELRNLDPALREEVMRAVAQESDPDLEESLWLE